MLLFWRKYDSYNTYAVMWYSSIKSPVKPLDAMATVVRIQRLPKSRNPASIGDDNRGSGSTGTKSIVSAVRAVANAVVDTLLRCVSAQEQSTQTNLSPHFWLVLTGFLTIQWMYNHLHDNDSTSW
jgi:hypothetical protein